MPLNRRKFIGLAGASIATGLFPGAPNAAALDKSVIKAVAFDGFTTFDPRSVFALAEKLFPGNGAELGNAWRTRQFEYAWLRTLTGDYADFWHVTEDALVFAAKLMNLNLTSEKRDQLMRAFLELKAWPDALPALRALKEGGLRLVLLSNFTVSMLDAAVRNSGLQGIFEPHLSTDRVRAFKPDPRAYRMALDALGLKREEIAFAAFGGWDAVGAKAFGYRTFWVNRMGLPVEEMGSAPDAAGPTLEDLARFLLRS